MAHMDRVFFELDKTQKQDIKDEVLGNPDKYPFTPLGKNIGRIRAELSSPVGEVSNSLPRETIKRPPISWSDLVSLVGGETMQKVHNDNSMLGDVTKYPVIDLNDPGVQSIFNDLVGRSVLTTGEKTAIDSHKTILDPNYQETIPGPSTTETLVGDGVVLNGGDLRWRDGQGSNLTIKTVFD